MSILEPIQPKILAIERIPNASPAILQSYGADPQHHASLGLVTCDQDDSLYVALDEATKHADIDIVFARSFYAGAAHASGRLSGEILGVVAGADPAEIDAALSALTRCIDHDACFYAADNAATVAMFPHVVSSIGHYFAQESGLAVGEPMAYLVAPPLEAGIAIDCALKNSAVTAVKVFAPPTETNFAGAWLNGTLDACQAAASEFAESVVRTVAAHPARLG